MSIQHIHHEKTREKKNRNTRKKKQRKNIGGTTYGTPQNKNTKKKENKNTLKNKNHTKGGTRQTDIHGTEK